MVVDSKGAPLKRSTQVARCLIALAFYFFLLGMASCPVHVPDDEWLAFSDGIDAIPIRGIGLDPQDPRRITILTDNGAFLSHDGGEHWTVGGAGLPDDPWVAWSHLVANALWSDPTGRSRLFAQIQGRVFASGDFGKSWTEASGKCPECTRSWSFHFKRCIDSLAGLALDPGVGGSLYAATVVSGGEGGVLRSADGGTSWSWAASSSADPTPCASEETAMRERAATVAEEGVEASRSSRVHPRRGTGLDARPRPGPTSSTKAGCPPQTGMENDAWPLAIDPTRSKVLFAGGPHPATDGGKNGLKRSRDGGVSWERITDERLCGEAIHAIIADPEIEGGWLVSGLRSYQTLDEGATWKVLADLPAVHDFVVDPKGYLWAVDHDGSLWQRDGESWQRVSPPPGIELRSLAVGYQDDGAVWLYGGTANLGLYRKISDGAWERVSAGLASRVHVSDLRRVGGGSLVVAVDQNGLFVRDSRRPWRALGPRLSVRYSDAWVARDLAEIYWAGADRVYRWRLGESNWTELTVHFGELEGRVWISRLRRHPRVAERVDAVAQDTASKEFSLLRFRAEADALKLLSATPLVGRNPYRGHVFQDLLFDPEDDDRLLLSSYLVGVAGDASGIQLSTDDGQSFERLRLAELTGDHRSIHQLSEVGSDPGTYLAVTWAARLFTGDAGLESVREVPTDSEWNGKPWTEWIWSVDIDPGEKHRLLAYDWHDDELYPEDRPARVRYARDLPTTGAEWIEISDDGLPRDAVGIDHGAVSFLPWDRRSGILATWAHGLWIRRLP